MQNIRLEVNINALIKSMKCPSLCSLFLPERGYYGERHRDPFYQLDSTRESQRERTIESQREPRMATEILSGSLSLTLFGSLWLSLALSDSLWHSLTLSGALWLSLARSLSPDLLTKPLLGSQGPCSAQSVVPALQHFILVFLFSRN